MNDTTYQSPQLEPAETALPQDPPPPPMEPPQPEPPQPEPPQHRLPRRRKDPDAPSEGGAVLFLLAIVAVLSILALVVALRWDSIVGPFSFPSPGGLPSLPSLAEPSPAQDKLRPYTADDGPVLTLVDRPNGPAMSLQDIYKAVSPSVVSIQTKLSLGYSEGTGVLMSADGYIITNEHVISGGLSAQVTLSDGRSFDAALVGSDASTDLAVLKIQADGLPAAIFGTSDQMEVGDTVVAIGNPLGSQLAGGSTMTDGILSAVSRDLEVNGSTMTLLQTTAALNSGNSGGALVNDQGQVIGITNMKLVDRGYSAPIEGLGFAIPTTVVKTVADSLIHQGYVAGRPMLGITVRPAYPEELEAAGVDHGLYLSFVDPGSDAAARGLLEGDLILAADGLDLSTNVDLMEAKADLGVGDTLDLLVLRDGETFAITITLVEQYALENS